MVQHHTAVRLHLVLISGVTLEGDAHRQYPDNISC